CVTPSHNTRTISLHLPPPHTTRRSADLSDSAIVSAVPPSTSRRWMRPEWTSLNQSAPSCHRGPPGKRSPSSTSSHASSSVRVDRSEEHTSELQRRFGRVYRCLHE